MYAHVQPSEFDAADIDLIQEITSRAMKLFAEDEKARAELQVELTKVQVKSMGENVRSLARSMMGAFR